MNYLAIINTVFFVYNSIVDTSKSLFDKSVAIYRFCTTNPTWYILDNGQFVDNSVLTVFDIDKCWKYENSKLVKDINFRDKKLPYLSFEFTYQGTKVIMDDFIENTRFQASDPPPLAVLMAAYSIQSKTLYPWTNSRFMAFTKMGDQIEFDGAAGKFPEANKEDEQS